MPKKRTVIVYGHFFEDFMDGLSVKVRAKILQILRVFEEIDIIPQTYLKHIEGTDGLYEIRVIFSGNIFRLFCCFDSGNLIVLLSGFQKKSDKTPGKEIDRAVRLMSNYYKEKDSK
ncbi:MAG: type II toxin-antitoxin system RelE/ParE family toxin [Bacteroidales bacterium]|nr:type II toxin-antitoxin system RelE/ParE family toxin [Bacteroidales bacterium]